jgi:hypothetical protein
MYAPPRLIHGSVCRSTCPLAVEHRSRAKWVFVPTHALGRTLGDRLVLEGTNWANLRFVTPLDIALRMGAPFLVERGIAASEEGLGPALVMRLLLDLPEEGGYFRPLADQPAMAQALWTTVRELRMAGVRAEQITPEAFVSPAKHQELRALLTAYETFLSTEQRGDMATVYEEAVLHADWCPIQPTDCWTEYPYAPWSPLQRALIDSLPGERVVPRAFEIAGSTLSRSESARGGGRGLGENPRDGAADGRRHCDRCVSGRAHVGDHLHTQGCRGAARPFSARARGPASTERGPPHAEDRVARIRAALSNLERFFAGTIHSFCAHLLRERPVEAGVSPGFIELDEGGRRDAPEAVLA